MNLSAMLYDSDNFYLNVSVLLPLCFHLFVFSLTVGYLFA